MHFQREQGIKDVFEIEKKVQQLQFKLETKDKELTGALNELNAAQRNKESAITLLKKSHELELENMREELNSKIEKLQTELDEGQ